MRGAPGGAGGKSGDGDAKGPVARTPKRTPGRLSRSDQQRIGNLLQRAYDDVLNEGVPDRFRHLLDKLDAGGGGGSSPTSAAAPDQQMSSQASAPLKTQNRESTE
jgi:hypothetical protein